VGALTSFTSRSFPLGSFPFRSSRSPSLQFSPVAAIFLIFWLFLSFSLGCKDQGRERPYGYSRLGNINDLPIGEKYLPQALIYLRRDEKGFSAMSTLCTFDLSKLHLKSIKQGQKEVEIWVSKFNQSQYAKNGDVLKSPSKHSLPYYQLEIAAGGAGSAADTLYVKIGSQVSKEWRLAIN